MIINIFEKEINKEEINKLHSFSLVNDKIAGKYKVAYNNNEFFVNEDWYNSEEKTAIALFNEVKKDITSDTYIEIEEGILSKPVPMFGVTVEDNFNIQQFNINRDEINGNEQLFLMIKNISDFSLWNLNKELFFNNGKKISEKDFNNLLSVYKEQGYIAPIVLYADKDVIRPYYHDYIAYFYNLLNLSIFPVRLISYKDIKYLEKLNPLIYSRVKDIKKNKYYNPENNEDMSDLMLVNFSDKRSALKKFIKKDPINLDPNKKYNFLDFNELYEIIPYVFIEEKEELNKKLMDNIFSHNFSESLYYENDKQSYDMTISESMYRYINGYIPIENNDISEIQNNANALKVKKEIDFDPSLLSLDTFDYIEYRKSNLKEIQDIIDKFGPNCIYDKAPNDLFDMNYLNNILENDIKIKVLTRK